MFLDDYSQEHLGVQATGSQRHPSGLPRHSSSQRQEPTRSALLQGKVIGFPMKAPKKFITGNGRASPPYGNLCSLLHLGRPQLKQVAIPIFLTQLICLNFLQLQKIIAINISCRKDSGQSGWWQLSKFLRFTVEFPWNYIIFYMYHRNPFSSYLVNPVCDFETLNNFVA